MSDRINIGLQLLDDQLIDSDGVRCGRVDDVELEGGIGKEMRVAALLAGVGAWKGRVPERISGLVPAVLSASMVRIAWEAVDDVSTAVSLSRSDWELGIGTHDGRNVRWVDEDVGDALLLSSLLGCDVLAGDGQRKLGRVWDLRAEREGAGADTASDESWRVTGLLVGRAGLLQRLGIAPGERLEPPQAPVKSGFVNWERVQRLEDDSIVCVDY